MKKILLLFAFPLILFSQNQKKIDDIISEITIYLQEIDYHYDDVYMSFNSKKSKFYKPIEKINNNLENLYDSYINEEEFYKSYKKLLEITKNDCFSCKFIIVSENEKKELEKIEKIDKVSSTIKLVEETGNIVISINYNDNKVEISSIKTDPKKINKINKKLIKKDFSFIEISQNKIIELTKSNQAVDLKNNIDKLEEELKSIETDLEKYSYNVIEEAYNKDKKYLEDKLEHYKNIKPSKENLEFNFEWLISKE